MAATAGVVVSHMLSPDQVDSLLPVSGRSPVKYGTALSVAVALPGNDWAENAALAGHVAGMDGLDAQLRGRLLLNGAHVAALDGGWCPTGWECLDVVPTYRAWENVLRRERQFLLMAARETS